MKGRRVPPLIPTAVVAKAAGITTRQARSLLRRSGVLHRSGRYWYARRGLLRERLEDVFEDVFAFYELPIEGRGCTQVRRVAVHGDSNGRA